MLCDKKTLKGKRECRGLFWFLYVILWLPLRIFVPFKIYGRENILKGQNYLITCNHQSFFDPVILDCVFRRRNFYIAKSELFNTKAKAFLVGRTFGGIPVDRSKGLTLSNTQKVYRILRGGKDNLGIFPEGTRRKDLTSTDSIKSGASLFAIRTRTPIIPCYIIKTKKVITKRVVMVGRPFTLDKFYELKLNKNDLKEADEILKLKMLELKRGYEKMIEEKKIVKKIKENKIR